MKYYISKAILPDNLSLSWYYTHCHRLYDA